MRDGRYHYILNLTPGLRPLKPGEHHELAINAARPLTASPEARRAYATFSNPPAEELYEVASDPGQIRNLATDHRYTAQLQELRLRLETYLKQTGDPRISGQDPWQAYVYRQTSGYGASFNTSLPAAAREAARVKVHRPE